MDGPSKTHKQRKKGQERKKRKEKQFAARRYRGLAPKSYIVMAKWFSRTANPQKVADERIKLWAFQAEIIQNLKCITIQFRNVFQMRFGSAEWSGPCKSTNLIQVHTDKKYAAPRAYIILVYRGSNTCNLPKGESK